MSHEDRQLRESRPARPSLFGDGLPERLRSTSFALLGIMVAACLGLVGFAFHQGWPVVPDLPIPGVPPRHEAVHERTVVAEATAPVGVAGPVRVAESESSPPPASGDVSKGHSRLAANDRVAAELVPPPGPGSEPAPPASEEPSSGSSPAPEPASPPPTEPAPPPAPPSPAPIASTPPAASSVDEEEGDEDDDKGRGRSDKSDDGDENDAGDAGKGRGQSRSKGGPKHRALPPSEASDEEDAYAPPADTGEQSDEDESQGDEYEAEDDEWSRGRGRGGWRRGR